MYFLINIPINITELVGRVSSMEYTMETIMKKVGIVICLIAIIAGTYILATTLHKMATEQGHQAQRYGKRFAVSAALIMFGITIGVIIVTISSSAM